METRDLVREFFDLAGEVMGRLTLYMRNAYMVEDAVLAYSSEILGSLSRLFWLAWDGDFEDRFLSPVVDAMRQFLAKVPEGWEFHELNHLREFKALLITLHKELRKEVEKKQEKEKQEKEKQREEQAVGSDDELPF